jgi:hypothetical protein
VFKGSALCQDRNYYRENDFGPGSVVWRHVQKYPQQFGSPLSGISIETTRRDTTTAEHPHQFFGRTSTLPAARLVGMAEWMSNREVSLGSQVLPQMLYT